MRWPFALYNRRYAARKPMLLSSPETAEAGKSKTRRSKRWIAGLVTGGLLFGPLHTNLMPERSQLPARLSHGSIESTLKDNPRELRFIDSRISDAGLLSRRPDVKIVRLPADSDAMARITEVLRGYRDLKAVHVFAHGWAGALLLGNALIDAPEAERRAAQLDVWGRALASGGEFVVHSHDGLASPKGQAFIQTLSRLTGVEVAEVGQRGAGKWVHESHEALRTAAGSAVAARGQNGGAQPGPFTDLGDLGITDVYAGTKVVWGDFDNDGLPDAAVYSPYNYSVHVYHNDGNGSFTDTGADFGMVYTGATVQWADFDNDGQLDLFISSVYDSVNTVTVPEIFHNDHGTFTDTNATFGNISFNYGSSVAIGDFDNDGKVDIVFSSAYDTDSGFYGAVIAHNDGDGNFTIIDTDIAFAGYGAIACADFDNDGQLDLFFTDSYNAITGTYGPQIYHNDNGVFTPTNPDFGNLYGAGYATIAVGDFDNDGKMDILISNAYDSDFSNYTTTVLAHNNGDGSFTLSDTGIPGLGFGAIACGDLDNDGQLDVVVSGYSSYAGGLVTEVYHNDNGVFTSLSAGLVPVEYSSIAIADFDNDGDLDLLITGGALQAGNYSAHIYQNNAPTPNAAPNAPGGLTQAVQNSSVALGWTASTDAETPDAGLSYSLRVGTTPGGIDVVAPPADPATGKRRVSERGAVNSTSWTLKNLTPGTYYWSVQSVDTSFAGSPFATEKSFTITSPLGVSLSTSAANPEIGIVPFKVTITFDQQIDPSSFTLSDIGVTNGAASNLVAVTANTVFSADITPVAAGDVSVVIAAGKVNTPLLSANTASNILHETVGAVPPAPTFDSAPTANPNPATVGKPVQFTASASGILSSQYPITYVWDFGDGSSATGASVSHTFTPAKTYAVTVVATNSPGVSVAASIKDSTTGNDGLVVAPFVGASGGAGGVLPGEIDSDGDGFSDALENAYGSNPLDASSTPNGGAAPVQQAFTKPVLKLNTKKKSLTLTGKLHIPAGFNIKSQILVADIAGFTTKFQLDANGKGKGITGKNTVTVGVKLKKSKVLEQDASFKLALVNVPATVKATSPLQILIGGTVFTPK